MHAFSAHTRPIYGPTHPRTWHAVACGLLALLVAGALLAGCAPALSPASSHPAPPGGAPPAEAPGRPPQGETGSTSPGGPLPADRIIISEGTLTLLVDEPRATRETVEHWLATLGPDAFVVSSQESGGSDARRPVVNMVLRVPAERFDESMAHLATLAIEVRDRVESADDVTGEFVDVQARIEALEIARARLLEIMQNADTTQDLLEAEQQLTQREAELAALKGRLQFLSESARLSKISLTLFPTVLAQSDALEFGGWRLPETAQEAYAALLQSVQGFARFVVYFSIAFLPWLIVFGLIAYALVRVARRRQRPVRPAPPAASPPPPAG